MNTDKLLEALYGGDEPHDAGLYAYPERTPECPPLQDFQDIARSGWPQEFQEHSLPCAYCQRTLAAVYLSECPSRTDIAWCLVNGRNREALERHVYDHNCKRCQERFADPGIAEHARELANAGSTGHLARWWSLITDFLTPVLLPPPVPVGPMGSTPVVLPSAQIAVAGGRVDVERSTEAETIDIYRLPSYLSEAKSVGNVLPERTIKLKHGAGFLRLTAGELAGLEGESILFVCYPREDA